jgi:tripartite-type tricarboxylate transporter receptor subunit TctC
MPMKPLWCLVAAMLTVSSQANAQKFPEPSMTMVVPFAAGGPTDILRQADP